MNSPISRSSLPNAYRCPTWFVVAAVLVVVACGQSTDTTDHGVNRASAGSAGVDVVDAGGSSACAADCNDGFTCTIDSCVGITCRHSIGPNEGATACPTGQYCTVDKGCVGAPACATDAACVESWKDDACKANARCDAASSICVFDILDKDGDKHAPQICGGNDCNDGSASIYPGATESCNGIDDDCDGIVDEETVVDAKLCSAIEDCRSGVCACKDGNLCGEICADRSTDLKNCGTCGTTCSPNEVCDGGKCTCPQGMVCPTLISSSSVVRDFIPYAVSNGYVLGSCIGRIVGISVADGSVDYMTVTDAIYDLVVADGSVVYSGRISGSDYPGDNLAKFNLASALSVSGNFSPIPTVANARVEELLVRGNYVYWPVLGSSISGIARAPLDATLAKSELLGSTKCDTMAGDATKLFCAASSDLIGGTGQVVALDYDGVNPVVLTTNVTCPRSIAVNDRYVFWSDDCKNSIERIAKDGSDQGVVFDRAAGLLVDNEFAYVADGALVAILLSDRREMQLSVDAVRSRIVMDDGFLYWTEAAGLFRVAKPQPQP